MNDLVQHVYAMSHVLALILFLFLTIFNKGAYLTLKSIFNKALNLFKLDSPITLDIPLWSLMPFYIRNHAFCGIRNSVLQLMREKTPRV